MSTVFKCTTGSLTLSLPISLRLYTVPYWSNPPFLIFDIQALWRSGLSARMSKITNGGLDLYGAGPFEQHQFGTRGIEWVNVDFDSASVMSAGEPECCNISCITATISWTESTAGWYVNKHCVSLSSGDREIGSLNRNCVCVCFLATLATELPLLSFDMVFCSVWFKLTVTEMTMNGNKSNPLTVMVTVTEKFH